MREYKLTDAENKLADIIWKEAPISSPELVKLCDEKLQWKKSTTYTMLKKLELKELFKNNKGVVISLISKDEFFAEQTDQIVENGFSGSFPKFLAAFARHKKLSNKEIMEIKKIIDDHKEV